MTHQSPLDEIDYARIDLMQLDRIGRSQNCRYATPSKVARVIARRFMKERVSPSNENKISDAYRERALIGGGMV